MTKYEVLAIFAEAGDFLIPDDVRIRLEPMPDRRSIYSYLGRLARQSLLERGRTGLGGMVAYRLTDRGRARLEYFQRKVP